ncbi:hypothetical protein AK812_SmicGene8688 [Symbiodinium microadriaticum]|uniref:Uncharacterized protein n=1 Tax=Symbiodinium microadriaticum TaxID=2951 RepID=A0A1Q9EKC5_SYMMI|nr:hypothetical protein AK812_SmicGene8688 [Symbiodinium microadriaticum]
MASNLPEEGPTEQRYEWSASVPTERSPASTDDLPPAEIDVSSADMRIPPLQEKAHTLQDSAVASSDGRNGHATNEGTASEHSLPSSENDVAASLTECEGVATALIVRMEPVRPDIIQAVPAYEVVRRCGRVFRARNKHQHYSRVSFQTAKIEQFWSHSWHGPKWNKALTAIYLNNGMVAAVVATLVSFVLMFLHAYRFLPALRFGEKLYPSRSCWISVTCIVLYYMIMFLWRPQQKIFLDALCIQQGDSRSKALGLVSMGAFLRASDSLVVLWDPSWSRRLWCVFELAAFLHSRQLDRREVKLTIRPTMLGPCFISLPIALSYVMLALTFFPTEEHLQGDMEFIRVVVVWPAMGLLIFTGFYCSVVKLRAYFRYVQALEQDIGKFVVDDSTSYCCSVGHVRPDGGLLPCDRRVILQCIRAWFGSVENFEALVRTDVLQSLQDQLSREVFTYKQIAVSAMPLLWHYMDSAATIHYSYIVSTDDRPLFGTLREFIRGLAWAFGVVPVAVCIAVRLSYLLQRRHAWALCDIMGNLLVMFVIFLFVLGALVFELRAWEMDILGQGISTGLLPGSSIFSATMIAMSFVFFAIRYFALRSMCAFREKEAQGSLAWIDRFCQAWYAFILMALYFLQDGLADSDLATRRMEDEEKLQQRVDEIKDFVHLRGFFAFYGGSLGPTYQYEPFNWGQEDPVEHSRNLRDVLWMHPKSHEKQLQDEISRLVGWTSFAANKFSDFPPFPLAQAMPWGNGISVLGKFSQELEFCFMGGSLNLKGKGRRQFAKVCQLIWACDLRDLPLQGAVHGISTRSDTDLLQVFKAFPEDADVLPSM